jgi:glycerophosphoryl diester phosphodiesterase
MKKLDIQGHRGCRGLMPENTIPAMLHALDLGVTTLETDVVITADNIPLLSHEPFFNHEISLQPNGLPISEAEERNFNIFRMTLEETSRFDVGLKPHPRFPRQRKMAAAKPSLQALFDSVARYMNTHTRPYPRFNIETKCLPATDGVFHPEPGKFMEMVMDVVARNKMEQQVTIQSFDIRTLQALRKKYPLQSCALLIEETDLSNYRIQLGELGFKPEIYSPHFSLVSRKLTEELHAQDIRVIPWTVNDRATIDRLISDGVDGIITDYPDLFGR